MEVARAAVAAVALERAAEALVAVVSVGTVAGLEISEAAGVHQPVMLVVGSTEAARMERVAKAVDWVMLVASE